ncbi:MAG: hypothetical protein J3Q66DRAFT_351467 [Benniella sp.]|nr:MAG: hypothetical protein J3Q66DRAFT_351467 [Benniella sp.]
MCIHQRDGRRTGVQVRITATSIRRLQLTTACILTSFPLASRSPLPSFFFSSLTSLIASFVASLPSSSLPTRQSPPHQPASHDQGNKTGDANIKGSARPVPARLNFLMVEAMCYRTAPSVSPLCRRVPRDIQHSTQTSPLLTRITCLYSPTRSTTGFFAK